MAASTTPISTQHSYFMYKVSTTWTQLFDFKTDPDESTAPDQLEVTTQSSLTKEYIEGLRDNPQKQYTCNYDLVTYRAIKALKGVEQDVAEWFGAASDGITPDGHDGKFAGKGFLDVYWNGGDANTVRNMTVTLTMTKAFADDSTVSA